MHNIFISIIPDLKVFMKYNYIWQILVAFNSSVRLFIIVISDVFMFRKNKNLQSSMTEQSSSFSQIIIKWWKSLNHNVAYKLLHMAQNGEKTERLKAIYTLNSLKYLKGTFLFIMQ